LAALWSTLQLTNLSDGNEDSEHITVLFEYFIFAVTGQDTDLSSQHNTTALFSIHQFD